ncbi:hypothetical protein [Sporolactobacillus sp. KGMB 08714]|uniref:hypothetical protein n=1 Tax=Sporolactobacillus sp. KGMB 08714 TaxID=3064704 RepID=UPI002FBE1C48
MKETMQEGLTRSKHNLWDWLAEDDLYNMMQRMGASLVDCRRTQKKRLLVSVVFGALSGFLGYLLNLPIFIYAAPIVPLIVWQVLYRMTRTDFVWYQFRMEYLFGRFMQDVLPRLEMNASTLLKSCRELFEGMAPDDVLKEPLNQFLIGLRDEPESEAPFTHFVKETCASDEAYTFMHTLYDYQQSSNDPEILYQLSRQNQAMILDGQKEISRRKLRRLMLFPTITTLLIMIPELAICATPLTQLAHLLKL